jgi:hypothetical protein
MRRLAFCALVVGAAAVASGLAAPAPPSAGTPPARPEQAVEHRAAVVVDTGSGVRYGCVRFTAESISAKQALEQAAMDPVFQEFGGNLGSAVCSLCGTGCPVGSCLTCAAQVWSYWRQPAGSGGFTLSGAGVSNVAVRDGDIEGWVWGRTGPPPGITVENVCGSAPVPPAPPPAPDGDPTALVPADPGPPAGSEGATDGIGGAPADPGTASAGAGDPAAAGEDAAAAARKAGKKTGDRKEPRKEELTAAATADEGGGGGGPPASLLGLLALLVALAGAAVWIRHVRSRPAPVETS